MAKLAEFKDLIAGRLAWPWACMRNEGIVATQTAQSLCRKTPNCHFLSHGEYHIGRDLVPTRAYAIPAYMACLQMSLDVLSD